MITTEMGVTLENEITELQREKSFRDEAIADLQHEKENLQRRIRARRRKLER